MSTKVILLRPREPRNYTDLVAEGEIERTISWFRNDRSPPLSGFGPYQSRAFPYIEFPPYNERWPVHVENFLNVKTRENEKFWTVRLRYTDDIPSEVKRNTRYLFSAPSKK